MFPGGSAGKGSACNSGDLGWEDPLDKGTATRSSILACIVREVTKKRTQLNHFHTWKNTYMETQRTLDSLNNSEKGPTKVRQILPDLQIYHKATVKQNMGLWTQRSKEQDTEHGHESARSQSIHFQQQAANAIQQGRGWSFWQTALCQLGIKHDPHLRLLAKLSWVDHKPKQELKLQTFERKTVLY